MEFIELDDSEGSSKSMMCPDCGLPLYQKDHRFKFFLFCCRACGYEFQLDHESSWEMCSINKKSILPSVKHQYEDGEEDFGGHPHKTGETEDDCDCPSTVDVDYSDDEDVEDKEVIAEEDISMFCPRCI